MIDLEQIYQIFLHSGSVTTDSRNVLPGSIFFGLRGDHFNGNHFAARALESGAICAIVDEPGAALNEKCLLVNDSLSTLQALASFHRKKLSAIIIAITGSNGKTTTKELTGAVLSTSFSTVFTRGNLNNHIGVPLTLLSLDKKTEFAIVEMGANHPGEIKILCKIADPDYGIITNIGKAHLEGFGGYQGVINAKSELYHYIREKKGAVFVNRDNDLLWELSEGITRISYGSSSRSEFRGNILENAPFLSFRWLHEGAGINTPTNLVGSYNFENAMAAVCIGAHFKVPAQKISLAIQNYSPENNRSQQLDTGRNILWLDAYNANPSSMKAALQNFAGFPAGNKVAILGDMMELGESSQAEHQEIIALSKKLGFRLVLFIGDQFANAAKGTGMMCFPDVSAAGDYLGKHPIKDNIILVKGSRKMQLEKLVPLL